MTCDICGHPMEKHKPSAHFPGMLSCVECPEESSVCLVRVAP